MNSDSLIQSVQDIFAILEERKIDYVLAGGIAILHYVEGRNTQDLDLLMALSSLEKLPELKIASQDMYFARANYGELQIDVLLTQNPLFKKVHKEYSQVQKFLDRNIPLATVEGLLLLKLYALPLCIGKVISHELVFMKTILLLCFITISQIQPLYSVKFQNM